MYIFPCNVLYVIANRNTGTPRDTCTRGEKAHTSKRVSIIACDNAISKAKLCDASPGREPYKSDDAIFLPVGKSDAPSARCVPLARCGLYLSLRGTAHCSLSCNALNVIARHLPGSPRDTVYSRGKGINKQKTNN